MKYLFWLIMCLTLFLCRKEAQGILYNKNITACNTKEPQKNLPWLAEMIAKAESDKTGNYEGTIWLEKYKGQDVFVTNMMLQSGGIAYWFFDCSGNNIAPKDKDTDFDSFMADMKLNVIVYSNAPY